MCLFFHAKVDCPEYIKDGKCFDQNCFKRHRQVCRYWKNNRDGCFRRKRCQFIHKRIKSFKNIRNNTHSKNDYCSQESESESEEENEIETEYTSKNIENKYKLGNVAADKAVIMEELKNILREVFKEYQVGNE